MAPAKRAVLAFVKDTTTRDRPRFIRSEDQELDPFKAMPSGEAAAVAAGQQAWK